MKTRNDDSFYIGYLPTAPAAAASFIRRNLAIYGIAALGAAVLSAVVLPYFGAGVFEFGRPRDFSGTIRCDASTPRLSTADGDYLLVGYGKHAAMAEICGGDGTHVTLQGTLIEREDQRLLEVPQAPRAGEPGEPATAAVALGRFTLIGEIVDAKCYFGVMNPAEGRVHRACAELCLRGGVPAVLVVRDKAGGVAHLLLKGAEGNSPNDELLQWAGEPIEVAGEVSRQGLWLVLRPDFHSLRFAPR